MPKTKTILVVDDDSHALEYAQYILMTSGYEVITAKNGEEAVSKYKTHNPDFVFLDIRMPVMDGFEAFDNIIQYDQNAKVAFITAFTIDDQRERFDEAKKKGLVGLITKPYSLSDLEKVVSKYIKIIQR